ncbi:MAG: YaaA family protein, partial [Mycobacteriales bacterium]
MLILLPPSEGKAPGGDGPAVDLAALSWPELTTKRQKVLLSLTSVCRRSPAKARALLGLSAALDGDRAANAEVDTSPTMPAGHRYTGVLHDALGYQTLPTAARRRADRSIVVFSGLWGAVRPTDQLPAYRIGIGTNLPRIGPLPTYWRAALNQALDDEIATNGALDLRSS